MVLVADEVQPGVDVEVNAPQQLGAAGEAEAQRPLDHAAEYRRTVVRERRVHQAEIALALLEEDELGRHGDHGPRHEGGADPHLEIVGEVLPQPDATQHNRGRGLG